jgi:hypothetical protein
MFGSIGYSVRHMLSFNKEDQYPSLKTGKTCKAFSAGKNIKEYETISHFGWVPVADNRIR